MSRNLISTRTQAVIKAALANVAATFFKQSVTVYNNSTVTDQYGEAPVKTRALATIFNVFCESSVGKSARYQDVDKTDFGNRDQSSWHLYFWEDDIVRLGVVINDETDTVSMDVGDGKGIVEYEIRLLHPSALFDDLGYLLREMELKIVA